MTAAKPIVLHRAATDLKQYSEFKKIRKRVPQAEWMTNHSLWDKEQFITETAEFLDEAYGICNDQDKHVLAMLAMHMETFILCCKQIEDAGLMTEFNAGQNMAANPLLTIRAKTTTLILALMNELGLTPKGRLLQPKNKDDSDIAKFLAGPLG